MINVIDTKIKDLKIIEPKVFADSRGFFMESWNQEKYFNAGINVKFVQDNLSLSSKNVLRGLHFQNPNPQAKLVSVIKGSVLDVAVDIRTDSPTYGWWESVVLSEANKKQLLVPPGFAHGFLVLSKEALFSYKCSDFYSPKDEHTILWSDKDLNIDWKLSSDPIVSEKDQKGLPFKQIKGIQSLEVA